MSKNNGNGKALRYGELVRVSTEKQEQQGESLRTQRKDNQRDVERMGGIIVARYGGQEHATEGWERRELDRLLADATTGKFDAIIVNTADRWSRDNERSEAGLDALRSNGIRFFVGTMEMDLFDPQHRFILGVHGVVGKFIAAQQSKKSIENRIERAKRGIPAAGSLPFGRTFDSSKPEGQQWGIDAAKHAIIQDIARRYLKGESLLKLCKEHGLNHSNICQVLASRSGTVWEQRFRAPRLNIDELVPTIVPRLLDDEQIRLLRHRLTAKRTYQHGAPTHAYLLGGFIFCSACGYNMVGQPENSSRIGKATGKARFYYRHAHHDEAMKCPITPKPWVPVERIEQQVISQLFGMFGNPTAIERAIRSAVPEEDGKGLERKSRLQSDLAAIEKARGRVLGLIEKDLIDDSTAEAKLRELKERETLLRVELDKLSATLADVPDEETVRCYIERVEDAMGTSIAVLDDDGNQYNGGNDVMSRVLMTWEEKRNLVRAVFSAPLADGKPAGVYVSPEGEARPHRPRSWGFKLRGRLEFESVLSFVGQPP